MKLRELLLTEAVFDLIDGYWITEFGEILSTDHKNGIHHSHLALDAFGDENMMNDDGEYDKYSATMAEDQALENGWIRCNSQIKSKTFSVEWYVTPSTDALKTLLKMIQTAPEPYKEYDIDDGSNHESFKTKGAALRFITGLID